MSAGPQVVLPHVDVFEHLPPFSTLLTGKQNAVVHRANFKYGAWVWFVRLAPYMMKDSVNSSTSIHLSLPTATARQRRLHPIPLRQAFLQLVHARVKPGRGDSEINNLITSLCYVKGAEGAKINKVARETRLTWIRNYRKALKDGKDEEEALLLKPVDACGGGQKPVFTDEVRYVKSVGDI
jgi:hypothetical protein